MNTSRSAPVANTLHQRSKKVYPPESVGRRRDLTETRWNMQQSREDAMERNWQKRSELNNLANLFGV